MARSGAFSSHKWRQATNENGVIDEIKLPRPYHINLYVLPVLLKTSQLEIILPGYSYVLEN